MSETRPIAAESAPRSAEHAAGAGLAALEVASLRKTYPGTRHSSERVALDGVHLTVQPREWVALLGPNGSGKSTLVRMISGADAPDSGAVRIFGADRLAAGGRLAAARLGVVFQRPGLDPLLTVKENLDAQAAIFGLRGAERAVRIEHVAQQLGLAGRMKERIATLSGGYQRRVDLARALLHEPDLLILDEATSALDHQARSGFLDAIDQLRAEATAEGRALTILMTTHLMDEAERAGRVVMMAAGRIVADAPPAELRAACGGHLVRARPSTAAATVAIERVLREAGLEASAGEGGMLIGRTPHSDGSAAIERAAAALARLGAAFEVAPPNLGDAYLAMTGTGLEGEAPVEPPRSRRRAR